MRLLVFPAVNDEVPSVSPFCHKAITFLTMVGVEFEVAPGDPRRTPNKKLPALEHDGQLIADSQGIIDYVQELQGVDLYAGLSAVQMAEGHLLRRTIEDGYYFVMLYSRWVDDDGWVDMKPVVSSMLPPVIGGLILPLIRRGVRKSVHAQGTSRRDKEGVYDLGRRDLDSLAERLGHHDFAVSDEPTGFDATLFGFLMNTIGCDLGQPLREHAESLPPIVEYCERMTSRYFQ